MEDRAELRGRDLRNDTILRADLLPVPHHLAPVEREKRGAGAWRDLEKKKGKKNR